MKIEIKDNMDLGENKIEFKQTSAGIWYCSGFTLYCKVLIDGVVLGEYYMEKINESLLKINKAKVK